MFEVLQAHDIMFQGECRSVLYWYAAAAGDTRWRNSGASIGGGSVQRDDAVRPLSAHHHNPLVQDHFEQLQLSSVTSSRRVMAPLRVRETFAGLSADQLRAALMRQIDRLGSGLAPLSRLLCAICTALAQDVERDGAAHHDDVWRGEVETLQQHLSALQSASDACASDKPAQSESSDAATGGSADAPKKSKLAQRREQLLSAAPEQYRSDVRQRERVANARNDALSALVRVLLFLATPTTRFAAHELVLIGALWRAFQDAKILTFNRQCRRCARGGRSQSARRDARDTAATGRRAGRDRARRARGRVVVLGISRLLRVRNHVA